VVAVTLVDLTPVQVDKAQGMRTGRPFSLDGMADCGFYACGGEVRLGKHWRPTPRRSPEELEAVCHTHRQCPTPL
jgi:hypothetical protein